MIMERLGLLQKMVVLLSAGLLKRMLLASTPNMLHASELVIHYMHILQPKCRICSKLYQPGYTPKSCTLTRYNFPYSLKYHIDRSFGKGDSTVLYINSRNTCRTAGIQCGYRLTSHSIDGGETWTPLTEDMNLPEVVSLTTFLLPFNCTCRLGEMDAWDQQSVPQLVCIFICIDSIWSD